MKLSLRRKPDPTELRRRGNALFAARSYGEARSAFEQLIEAHPNLPEGYDGVARVLDRTGDLESIHERLGEKAIELGYPRLLRTIARATKVLVARGRKDLLSAALRYFGAYHQVSGDAATFHEEAELHLIAGDRRAAIECFRRAWEAEPKQKASYLALLNCLRAEGLDSEIMEAKARWKALAT